MSKSKAVEHVQIWPVRAPHAAPALFCQHCEETSWITKPTTLFALQKRAAAFTLMHEDCEKPSRQLPLPSTGSYTGIQSLPVTLHQEAGLRDSLAERIVADAIAVRQEDGRLPKVPTTWLELWDALEEALAPHEYAACEAWTPFVELIGNGKDFATVATWAALEVGNWDGALMPRPVLLVEAIDRAVADARARHQAIADKARAEPKPKKPRSSKRPLILFVHASNDTWPTKSAPNHLHRTVSTVEQADSLRGLEVQSVKLLGGVWDIPLLTYLKTQVLGPMNVPVSEGKVTAAATEPVTDGAL